MATDNQAKTMKYLVEVEQLAQEIMSDRKEVILLDKRKNQNRQALRAIKNSGQSSCYIVIGSILFKNNVEQAVGLLEADQKQVNTDINRIRSNLKIKMNNLRDLEMLPPVPGSSLLPLTNNESRALNLAYFR